MGPDHRRRALRCVRELMYAVNACIVKPAEARVAASASAASGKGEGKATHGGRAPRLPLVANLHAELRRNFRETDPMRAEEQCLLAERYAAHLVAVSAHRDMVYSYGWAVDQVDDMDRVRKTAARVGLSVPTTEEGQAWDSGRVGDLLTPPRKK